jgi:circadian clock protein KaiC
MLEIGLGEAVDAGVLTIKNLGQEDESMDEMGHKLLRLVDEMKVRRLVVDGLAGLADTLAFPERGYRFLGRLLLELRARGVTSLFTVDPSALAIAAGTSLAEGVVGWFDNAFTFEAASPRGMSVGIRNLAIEKVRGGRATQAVVNVHIPSLESDEFSTD